MAGQIFSLEASAISLTDSDRQWFMSRLGVTDTQMPRHDAPCNEVTQSRDRLLVPDLLANPRYADSTLAGTGARFYAGAPLTTNEGHCLGSLSRQRPLRQPVNCTAIRARPRMMWRSIPADRNDRRS